ncbi:DMT family transporter [Bosea sp. (in: a-proteobacteria)]|uniref:DMT family transporter n=1 Tax=Bosea sp. (in: a-proteobacteria) TaxID=1871050 RepID=UPI001AC99111|nr:DMT family transporter [Bosea sp. (in: a-proteobacteria)]MBN9441176.1 DMT family transporter [Bosea sp. (in: a-proteobacteria)]
MASAADNRRGILFMLAAMTLFVCNDTLMKLAREIYPAGQALTLRAAFAVVIGLALVFAVRENDRLTMMFKPRVVLRGLLEAASALAFGWSLGLLPLATITAINMASPLLIVVLAVALRIESVGWRRTLALIVGFVGVLIVVRPGADSFGIAAIVALISTIFTAGRDLSTRMIGPEVPSTVVSLTTTILVGLLGAGFGITESWLPVWRHETLYVLLASLLVTAGTFCIISAFRRSDVSVVSQYRYAVIVIAALIGYLVWGDVPDGLAFAGIALIVGSGLYTMHRQRKRPDSRLKLEKHP